MKRSLLWLLVIGAVGCEPTRAVDTSRDIEAREPRVAGARLARGTTILVTLPAVNVPPGASFQVSNSELIPQSFCPAFGGPINFTRLTLLEAGNAGEEAYDVKSTFTQLALPAGTQFRITGLYAPGGVGGWLCAAVYYVYEAVVTNGS